MRKKLFLLLLLLLIPALVYAWGLVITIGGGTTIIACTEEESYPTDDGSAAINSDDRRWYSGSWTTSKAYTVTKIDLTMERDGAPGCTIVLTIYDNNGGDGKPASALATSSNTITCDDITTSTGGETISFLFAGYSLSNATRYHAVLVTSGGTVDGSNDIHVDKDGNVDDDVYRSADGSSWVLNVDDATWKAAFYSGGCL